MSSLSVFPPPPAEGEITLCEFNAKLIAESSKTAKLSKYIPATQVWLLVDFADNNSKLICMRKTFRQFKFELKRK